MSSTIKRTSNVAQGAFSPSSPPSLRSGLFHLNDPSTHPPTDPQTLCAGTGGQDGAPQHAVADEKKRIYLFHEGRKEDKGILGGKGANLCEVCSHVCYGCGGGIMRVPSWMNPLTTPNIE